MHATCISSPRSEFWIGMTRTVFELYPSAKESGEDEGKGNLLHATDIDSTSIPSLAGRPADGW